MEVHVHYDQPDLLFGAEVNADLTLVWLVVVQGIARGGDVTALCGHFRNFTDVDGLFHCKSKIKKNKPMKYIFVQVYILYTMVEYVS